MLKNILERDLTPTSRQPSHKTRDFYIKSLASMKKMRSSGATLRAIGSAHSISHERTRQILSFGQYGLLNKLERVARYKAQMARREVD